MLVAGYGAVGRAFVALADWRRARIRAELGVDLSIEAVSSSTETRVIGGQLSHAARARAASGEPLAALGGRHEPWNAERAIGELDLDVLVEATSGAPRSPEPALANIRCALARGLDVAAASKNALVWRYDELEALARDAGRELRIGAATGAALPAIDVAEVGLAGAEIRRVEGVLNGTSNYILTRMQGMQASFDDVLREAQALGVAEPDATADVEGHDTASKLVLIGNALLRAGLRFDDVKVRGITGVTAAEMSRATEVDRAIRLVGRLERGGKEWRASVEPEALPVSHPLHAVRGLDKGISYTTDTMDVVTVIGGRSSPNGAAAALLRDVIGIARRRRR